MILWSYIDICIAGTIRIGIFDPIAVVAKVVTVVSSMPCAIFEIVLAVHGQMSSRSAGFFTCPQNVTCSVAPVNSVIGFFPVANHIASGCMIFVAFGVITGITFAPCLISSRASLMVSTAAMLPVIPNMICFLESKLLLVSRISSAGCIFFFTKKSLFFYLTTITDVVACRTTLSVTLPSKNLPSFPYPL